MDKFDIIVIGGGPAGYVTAIRSAQLGKKVAIIDKRKALGGTCLNIGCIPSKALLDSSEKFYDAKENFKQHGIELSNLKVNIKQMFKRKDNIVSEVTKGVDYLMQKNKITRFVGHAQLISNSEVSFAPDKGKSISIQAKHIILATGSVVSTLPHIPVDGKHVITSDHALFLEEIPKRMIVIGAGAIGLELGSIWNRLGSEVSIIELMPNILYGADKQMAQLTQRILEKQGIHFFLGTKVQSVTIKNQSINVVIETKDKKNQTLTTDKVLSAVGRKAVIDDLGLEKLGILLTPNNKIQVNSYTYETNIPNVFAIGDIIDGPMLAHKASEEAIVLAENLCGQKSSVNYDAIPKVIYTHPEVAWVGKTEEELIQDSVAYNVGSSLFKASGRAKAMNAEEGKVKVLTDKQTDKVLGIHIVGAHASELIAEAVLGIEFGAFGEDISRTVHAHPTLSESLKEASLASNGRAIHG